MALVEQPPMQEPNVWQRWGQVGIGRRCTGRSALSRRPGRFIFEKPTVAQLKKAKRSSKSSIKAEQT